MTSTRQIQANRRNARASTGPKTARGKDAAAHNAFRHGLSGANFIDPAGSATIEKIARQIAGADTGDVRECAHRVAEAEFELRYVRNLRARLFKAIDHRGLNVVNADPLTNAEFIQPPREVSSRVLKTGCEAEVVTPPVSLGDPTTLKRIAALDRYEQRAISKRKFAIRDFDAAKTELNFQRQSKQEFSILTWSGSRISR